ncbi:MAG: class I SAM-dependent methyltransferase [Sedimentisphaerales bacterium]|nr:class I SAM-dependent methyltransferase [Sedimentisphaerales bacterium]
MNNKKRNFDKEAALWDENPARVKLAHDVAHAVTKQITLKPDMDVMDFGCGTGLLTLELQPYVRSITGVDNSQGMLDIFNTKVNKLKLGNIKSLLIDLDKGRKLTGNYQIVLSGMTLHHIKEIEPLFEQFYNIISPGGYLCLVDLDLDNGKFHRDNTGVFHFGFSRTALRKIFTDTGFENVKDITAAEVTKPTIDGEMKTFTVFLMTGQKKMNKSDAE